MTSLNASQWSAVKKEKRKKKAHLKANGRYSRRVTNFSESLTMEFSYPFLMEHHMLSRSLALYGITESYT